MTILHFPFNGYVFKRQAEFPILRQYGLVPLPPTRPLPEPLRTEVDSMTMQILVDRSASQEMLFAADDLRRAAIPETWEIDRSFLLTLDLKLRQALEERQAAEEVHEATAQAQVARLAAAAAAVRQAPAVIPVGAAKGAAVTMIEQVKIKTAIV